MLGKRLINSNSAAGATCTTDTLQILGDTSGIAYYKMSDATSEILNNVFSTWDSTLSSVPNYSEGNLRMTGGNGNKMGYSNISVSSGKWYWEHEVISIGGESSFGIARPGDLGGHYVVGTSSTSWGLYVNGNVYHNSSITTSGYMSGGFANGDIIGVELDIDNGTLEFYKNGTGYGNAFTGLSGTFLVAAESRSSGGNNDHRTNFGASAFDYTPSTGFLGISSLLSYDGTPTNVNFNVAGKFGNAGEFNGSSSKITNTGFNITGNRSVSFWVRMNSSSSQNTGILSTWNNGSDYLEGFVVRGGAASSNFVLSVGTTNHTINALNTEWNHIALIYDGTYYQVYFNGTQVLTNIAVQSGIEQLSNLQLGARHTPTDAQYFNGSIDNIRIFNKALTSTEVTTLYNEVYCQPTIVPTDYFEPVIYTGNGSTQSITSLNFAPDLTWVKTRSLQSSHVLRSTGMDSTYTLASNSTAALNTAQLTGGRLQLDSNGFTVRDISGNGYGTNGSSTTQVAWSWKAGGADVQNTDGSITSQVSANVDAGFSIVKTVFGSGDTSLTVGHGLNEAPTLAIVKRTDATEDWYVKYNVVDGSADQMRLNTTATSEAGLFTTTSTTAIGFGVTGAAHTTIAYCFHSVDGYSKIGSYIGTGASGNSIVTGFRPAFLMWKAASTAGSWYMYDNKRTTSNPQGQYLQANESLQEFDGTSVFNIDFNSNGFTINGTNNEVNQSGSTYIFMAFAEEVYNPNGVTRNATNPFGDASELALYKFEDNANDAEGSYNGTASNVTYATGYIDKAAVFNGSSSYITGFPTITNDITISLWFKSPSIPSSTEYLFGETDDEPITYDDYIGCGINTSGQIIVEYRPYNSNAPVSIASAGVFADNNWHLVSLTLSTSQLVIYVDGNVVGSSTITGTINLPDIALGAFNSRGTINQHFNGSIDQVRIFDRALDSGEVTQLYNE